MCIRDFHLFVIREYLTKERKLREHVFEGVGALLTMELTNGEEGATTQNKEKKD